MGFELGCTSHKLLPLPGSLPEGALDGDLRAEYFNSPDLSGAVCTARRSWRRS